MDAYKEFANADYKEYRPMAKNLSADKLAKWLQDPDTAQFRFGLYASLLGHCGTEKHARTAQVRSSPARTSSRRPASTA